jgi:hypothetical protein
MSDAILAGFIVRPGIVVHISGIDVIAQDIMPLRRCGDRAGIAQLAQAYKSNFHRQRPPFVRLCLQQKLMLLILYTYVMALPRHQSDNRQGRLLRPVARPSNRRALPGEGVPSFAERVNSPLFTDAAPGL